MRNLKTLRDGLGISQQKLAEDVGVTQQQIHKYENGITQPDIETLSALADVFETSIDYLVGRTDIRHKIEEVQPYDLNAVESRLIDKFRRLPARYRASIESLADDFLNK